MNCYIFDVHIDCCYYHNNSRYDLLELGPLNMINSNILIRISTILQGISSHDVPRNWWTDFSSWSDLRALIRTGTLLPIHRVLQYINQSMEALTNYETSIQMIDGNGDIEFSITEENHDILEGFTVKARRKRLRTLKYIAAFNVARYLDCEDELKYLSLSFLAMDQLLLLSLPRSLYEYLNNHSSFKLSMLSFKRTLYHFYSFIYLFTLFASQSS